MVPAEERLLTLCARLKLSENEQTELKNLLTSSLDWQKIFQLAQIHGVGGLLYYHLKEKPVPKKALEVLKQTYFYSLTNNMKLMHETKNILKAFNRKKIDLVLLKGVALLESIYHDDYGLRTGCDIDLLVKPEAFNKSESLLQSLGYQLFKEKGAKGRYHEKVHSEKEKSFDSVLQHFQYVKPGLMSVTELHWNFCGKRKFQKINHREFWRNLEETRIMKEKAKVFSPEFQLLQLALHFSINSSLCYRLKNLVDIHELINSRKIDWLKLSETAKKFRIESHVFLPLMLCQGFFDSRVPKKTMEELKPGLISRIVFAWIKKNFFQLHNYFGKNALVFIQRLLRFYPFYVPL